MENIKFNFRRGLEQVKEFEELTDQLVRFFQGKNITQASAANACLFILITIWKDALLSEENLIDLVKKAWRL
jgi:hypothetical protein